MLNESSDPQGKENKQEINDKLQDCSSSIESLEYGTDIIKDQLRDRSKSTTNIYENYSPRNTKINKDGGLNRKLLDISTSALSQDEFGKDVLVLFQRVDEIRKEILLGD